MEKLNKESQPTTQSSSYANFLNLKVRGRCRDSVDTVHLKKEHQDLQGLLIRCIYQKIKLPQQSLSEAKIVLERPLHFLS